MTPIDIDELRRQFSTAAVGPWTRETAMRLLDALAALRIAAEPFVISTQIANQWNISQLDALDRAVAMVKLPEGAGK